MKNKIEKESLFTGPHEVKLKEWISCAPFEELLGIKIIEAKDGHSHLTMPFVFKLAQGKGLAHGGAVVTLADTTVAMAVKSIVPPDSRFGTISLNSEFLAPVTKGILTAKAKIKLLENRMIQGVATVFNEDNMEVMKFSSLFKLGKDAEIMNDSKITEPIIPPMHSNPNLKEYRCPHCGKFLFKGNVKKLNMVCQYCSKMINTGEDELCRTDNEEITND
ncbi:MAG: PaaI family thioesterase [Bacteroidota bacterium]